MGLPRLQAETLELEYVIAGGEIVKTPDWVRCRLDGASYKPVMANEGRIDQQKTLLSLRLRPQVRGGMFERGPGIRPRSPQTAGA